MALKLVLFYNQFQRGFTETWYMPGTNPPSNLPPGVDNMLRKAIAFRATGTILTGARFSQTDARQSSTFRFGNSYTAANSGILSIPPAEDVVSTSLVWRLSDNTFHSKLMYVRGLVDQDVVRSVIDGTDVPSAALTAGLVAYKNAAIAAGMQVRYQKTPSNTPGFLSWQATQVAPVGGNVNLSTVSFQGNPAADLLAGNIVTFKGFKKNDLPGFPKTAKIIDVAIGPPYEIIITYRFRGSSTVKPGNAFASNVSFVYQNLAIQEFIEFSEHKTGRPFFQPRGRASVALRRV